MIKSILFKISFFLGIIFISIIFLPALILPQKVTLIGGKIMGYWTIFCLKVFLSVKINILGKENIIKNEGVTVKSYGTFIQGIIGIGGEKKGNMRILESNKVITLDEITVICLV